MGSADVTRCVAAELSRHGRTTRSAAVAIATTSCDRRWRRRAGHGGCHPWRGRGRGDSPSPRQRGVQPRLDPTGSRRCICGGKQSERAIRGSRLDTSLDAGAGRAVGVRERLVGGRTLRRSVGAGGAGGSADIRTVGLGGNSGASCHRRRDRILRTVRRSICVYWVLERFATRLYPIGQRNERVRAPSTKRQREPRRCDRRLPGGRQLVAMGRWSVGEHGCPRLTLQVDARHSP